MNVSELRAVLEILSATPAGILLLIVLLVFVVGLFVWVPTAIYKAYKANVDAQKQSSKDDANTIGALTTVLRSVMADISENTRRSSQAAERMVLTSDTLVVAMSDGFKNWDEKASTQQRELMETIGRHSQGAVERQTKLLEAIHANGKSVNQTQAVLLARFDRLGVDLTILVEEAVKAAAKDGTAQEEIIKSIGARIERGLETVMANMTEMQQRMQDCGHSTG